MGTIQIDGSTPKLTIGNATAEDALILFDGNAQDFYIGLDDSADDLLIGLGSTVGTTPIIAIDENKLSTFSGAITVGVDDAGHDVKFFGNTASAYMLWDTSADDLVLAGAAGIDLAGNIDVDGTANLDVVDIDGAVQIDGTVTVGVDDTGLDVKFFGATASSYMLWDESADDLNLIASGLGVGTAKDLGVGVHIRTADSGASVDGGADELVIEGSGHAGLSILTGTSNYGSINFGDSGDSVMGWLQYRHSDNSFSIGNNGAYTIKIDSAGAVTKPLQPAFLVQPSTGQSNIAIDSNVTVVWGTEVYDINADFASNTFTAPVTGKYQINVTLRIDNLDIDSTYYQPEIVTSNRSYSIIITTGSLDADPSLGMPLALSCLADMDASDTAYVRINTPDAGAAQADIHEDSRFSGYLAC